MSPRTVKEWGAYAAALSDSELYEVAAAANCAAFVRQLQDEGYAPHEITGVMQAFAFQLAERDVRPAGDGLYDYAALARRPLPSR